MSIPIYDSTKSYSAYLNEFARYEMEIKKEKYNKILDFLNDVVKPVGLSYKTLSDFKNISETRITVNEEHNIKIIEKHKKILFESLKITKEFTTDSDEDYEEDTILRFFKLILRKIDFKVLIRKTDGRVFWSFVNETFYKDRK